MAELPDVFKAKDHAATTIPDSWQMMEIVKSEYKSNSAKTGHYLTCQVKVIDGEYKGKIVFELMNLDNPNQTAVEIAQRTLAQICDACGIEDLEDSEDLHNIPMACKIATQPGNAGYPPKNVIKQYKLEGDMPEDGDNGDPFE